MPLIGWYAIAAIVFIALILWKTGGKKRPDPTDIHGSSGLATNAMLLSKGLVNTKSGEGIRLGQSDWNWTIRYKGENSVTVIGPPGTGKMTKFAAAMTVEYRGSMVILDPKGELLAITKRAREALGRVVVLCPFKEGLPPELAHFADETDSYNPLALLDPNSESFEINCDSLAETLVAPDLSGESKESGFFTGNAQAMVSGVIMYLVLYEPENANPSRLASIVCSDQIFAIAATAVNDLDNQFVKDRLSTFGAANAAEMKGGIGDILRTAREQLKWISSSAMARVLQTPKQPWRFDDLKRSRTTVYVVLPAKYLASSRRFFRLLLGAAVAELQSSPKGKYQVLCLADEFALLGRVPIFETVFAEGRGHGFQMMPLIQDIGQLKKLYGRDGYRTFLSGSEIQIFLPPRDLETAKELSDIAGRRTVVTESKSYSDDGKENTGYAETGRPVLYPQEIMALKPDEFIMVAPGLLDHVCKGLRWPYWELEDIAPLCDTNPYNPTVPKGFVTVECPHCKGEALRTNRGELNRGLGLPLDCRKCKKCFAVDELPQGEFVKGRPSIDMKTYIKQKATRK